MRRHSAILLLLTILGCASDPAIHVDIDRDAAVDAPLPRIELDGGPTCEETCAPAHACEDARCEDGTCLRTPRADGDLCADDGTQICVAHECRARGCGDGWREPGDDPRFAREGCDDARDDVDDACDASCTPRVATLATELEVSDDLAVAIDGSGRALVLAVVRTKGAATLWALRFDARLRALGERLAVATIAREHGALVPAAVGLATGGFAIALERDADGIVVGVLGPEDVVAPRWVSLGTSGAAVGPAIAVIDGGFVVAATDGSGSPDDPLGGVRARRFDRSGRALGAVVAVAEDRSEIEHGAVIAASGTTWRAVWSAQDALGARREVRTRLFESDRAISAEQRLAGSAETPAFDGHIAATSGGFAVAWIEAGAGGAVAHAASIAVDGTLSARLSIAGSGRPLFAPRALGLSGDASALLCVEGIPATTLRWETSGAAPPELSQLADVPADAVHAIAVDGDRVLLVWPTAEDGALRALVLPRS